MEPTSSSPTCSSLTLEEQLKSLLVQEALPSYDSAGDVPAANNVNRRSINSTRSRNTVMTARTEQEKRVYAPSIRTLESLFSGFAPAKAAGIDEEDEMTDNKEPSPDDEAVQSSDAVDEAPLDTNTGSASLSRRQSVITVVMSTSSPTSPRRPIRPLKRMSSRESVSHGDSYSTQTPLIHRLKKSLSTFFRPPTESFHQRSQHFNTVTTKAPDMPRHSIIITSQKQSLTPSYAQVLASLGSPVSDAPSVPPLPSQYAHTTQQPTVKINHRKLKTLHKSVSAPNLGNHRNGSTPLKSLWKRITNRT
ncbi:hypothetical protein BC832DRAFT_596239 [Gaertneriomyces semiglobifer]|nr:hypothetical protein BC832DRAFT_596239 [Gaertneriomyces semiglobifer]